MNNPKNILILGGTRFIGRELYNALSKIPNYRIYVFHRGIHELPQVDSRVIQFHGDRLVPRNMEILKSYYFDYVFDISGEDFCMVKNSVDILNQRCGKYIYCSSSSVYKPRMDCQYNEEDALDEHSVNKYIQNKIFSERYIMDNTNHYVIFRPSKVYGPNNYIDRESWFYREIKADKVISLLNNPIVHLTFVADVVSGLMVAIDNSIDKQTYNISGLEYICLYEYVSLIAKVINKPVQFTFKYDERVPYTNVPSRIINHDQLVDTGWSPMFSIEQGLRTTFSSYE